MKLQFRECKVFNKVINQKHDSLAVVLLRRCSIANVIFAFACGAHLPLLLYLEDMWSFARKGNAFISSNSSGYMSITVFLIKLTMKIPTTI